MLSCNRIYSEVLGVGISSDGSRESGTSHVDCNSMVKLIKETCRNSQVHLEDILYIESSGFGIQAVDEQMKRLVKTLLKGQKIKTEVICAASTNAIGHCQSAAGLVSIIVSVFAMHYDWVPHCFTSRITDLLDTAYHASDDAPAETAKDGHTSIKDGATVVISRGFGGTSGCVVLVPFRCKWPQTTPPVTVLLPLYARCDVGLDRICKAVENASRFHPEMLLLMEKSVLTTDTLQPTRGYMIISPEMEILASEKLLPCQVFQPSLTLVLFWGDFSSVEMSVDPELWQIPAFEESMKASDKILEELSMGAYHTIVECMAMPYRNLDKEANNRGSMTHTHIITGTAVQIGLAETVRQACGSWAAVAGGGLGVLAAAYHDGCLSQKQCIQVAYTLSSIAGCWIDDLETSCKYLVALVHLKVDEVYRLGPNIYILAILTDFLTVISLPRHIPHLVDNVEKQVSLKGGQFKPVINSPFFNPHLMLKIKDLAVQKVRRIIPHPKQWSDLALLTLSRSHPNSVTDLLCDAEYIINSILQPLNQPMLIKQLLRESDFVVMAHIPGCEGAIFSEVQKSFVQLDTTRILHWSPSLLDVLNVLGKVHTLGCKLDLSAIHHQLEYPLDCSVPPLSPLATWDHRTSWPLPQWMEFTCKEKDEFMTTYKFSLDEVGSESSLVAGILYHSWFAIATRLQNMDSSKPTAVRLFSIVEEQDIMLIESSTSVSLQAQLGCRTFNIFNEDGVILGGHFEELQEPPDQPIGDFPYACCDVNQDITTGHEQSVWTVEWEDDWQLYLWQILQTLKEKGDHQMDKGQRLVTILPEEALFLPQYHAQLLDHNQNSVTVSFEACTGLLRAGGVIFHFPLLPLGMKRRDRKCTDVSIFEVSPVEEHGHRHCIFDEKTGLVHVTVTKDSMPFQHPGNRCSAPENSTVAFCQAKQSREQTETQKQIDSISCHEVHPCLEKIGSLGHANLDEVKTCAADGVEELKGFGEFKMLENSEKIIVNHTETVWICNDISVLLFHGVITATQQQVAGFWSEEYPHTMLQVSVPGWWKPRHQHFLLLWVIAMYIMDMMDLETTHTILVYPPFDSLSFTLLRAASDFRCQVFALTQGSAVPEVFNKICPGVAIISQVFWSQQLPQHGSISGCTCVKWITGDITLAMDQLPSSSRLIQCGQPRNSAHVCITFNKNKTLVCVDPQQAIRGSIARLSKLKDEAFLHLDSLSSLDSATCELILSQEMSDCLGSGFELQHSAYFHEGVSLSLVLKVKQSEASYNAVQISTDSSTANLNFKRAPDLEKNNCTVADNQNNLVELAKFHDCDTETLGLKRISTISNKFTYPNRIGDTYDPEWGMQSNQFSSAVIDRENLCDFKSFPASSFNISEPNICLATPGWHEANYLPCRLSNEQVDTSFHTTGAMAPDSPHGMKKVTDQMLYMDSLSNCFGQGSASMQCAQEVPNKLPEKACDANTNCYLQIGLPALGTKNKDMYTERQIVSLSGSSAYNERYPSDSELQEARYFPFLEEDGYSDKDGHQDTSSFSEESYQKDGCFKSCSQMNDKGRELQLNSHSCSSLAAGDNINLKMPYGCTTLMYDQRAVQHQVNFLTNDNQCIPVPRPVEENSSNIYRTCTGACPSGLIEASGLWLRNVRMPEGESVCKQGMDFQIPSEAYLHLSFNAIQNIEGKEIFDSLSSPEKRTFLDNECLANEPSSSQEQQASTTSCEWHDPVSQKLGQQLVELLEDALEESGLLPLVTSARLTDLSAEMGPIQKLTTGTTTTVEVSSQISAEMDSSLADHVDSDGYVLVSTADLCSSTTGADFGNVNLWNSGAKCKVQTCATQKKGSFVQSFQDTRIPLCGFDSAPSSFSVSEHTRHPGYPHPQDQTHSVSTPENLSRLLKNYFETSSGLDTAKTSQTGFEELPDQRISKHCMTYSMELATEAMCHMAASNEPIEETRCTSGCLDINQAKPIECPDSRHQGKTAWPSGHDELSEFSLTGSCITQEAERLHGMLESKQSLHCTEASWQEQVRHGKHEETSFSREISMSESVLLSNSPDSISSRKPAFSLDPFTIRNYALSSSLSHQQQSPGAISYLSAKSPWSRDFASMYQFCDDALGFGRRRVEVKHKSNQPAEDLFLKSKSIDKMSCSMDVDLGLLENQETLKTLDNVEILSLARQPSQHNLGNSSTPKPMCQITGVFLQHSWSDDTSSQNCKEYRNLPNPILPELLKSEDALVSPPVSFHFNSGVSRKDHEESQAEHQEQLASDTDDNIDLDFAFQFDSYNHEDNSVMLELPRNIPLPLRNLQGQEIEDESSQSGDSGIEFHLTEEISSSNQHRCAFNLVSKSKKDSHLVYSLLDEGLGPIAYDSPPLQQQLSSPYEEMSYMQHQHSAVDVSTDQVQSPGGRTSFMQQTSSGVEHDVDFHRQLLAHPHSFSDETPACSQSAHVLQSCLHQLCGGSESLQTTDEEKKSQECVLEINKNKASDICQKYFEPNALISVTPNNEIQVQENPEESQILKSDSVQEFQRSKTFFSRIIYQNQEVIPPEKGASCDKARYEKELKFTSNTLDQDALLSGNSVLHLLDSQYVEQRTTDENSSGVLPACAATPVENFQDEKRFQTLQPTFSSLTCSAQHSLLIKDFPSSTPAELQQLNKPSAAWRFKRPLYLVHPITGSIEIFRLLASKLSVCCIGIQRTSNTPTSSVEDVARHYCAAIKCNDRFGPYQLAGYSYGGLLVFEMARQFQQEGKRVELLLMLDGSPDYVKGQIEYIRGRIPANTGQEEGRRIMESHFLLHFMDFYGHVLQRTLVQAELERSPSLKEKITLAVKLTKMMGKDTSILSSSKRLGQKPGDYCKTPDAICEAVEKSVDFRHQQKAADFLTAAFMASKYIAVETQESRFVGDAHLIRIKKCPLRCMVLPADYGLSTLCTGNVKICYVNGDHESIFHDPYVQSLASIIHAILGKK